MRRFLTGLAAGLVISYLTAPNEGKKTRTKLAETAKKETEAVQDKWKNLCGQWQQTVLRTEQFIENIKSSAGFLSAPGSKSDYTRRRVL